MSEPDISLGITEKLDPEIDESIARWEHEEGNLIMVFHEVQSHYGYVPRNIAMYVARRMDVPLARVYEIITFYNFFNLEPPAQYTIEVCTGTACYLKGAPALIEAFKKGVGIGPKEQYSGDRKFKVAEVRCLGCCGLAPVVTVNGKIHGRVKPEMVGDILAGLHQGAV